MLKKLLSVAFMYSAVTLAAPITETSGLGYNVKNAGATSVGGIVAHLKGVNGVNVISQLSADSLYQGYFYTTFGTIGIQNGFSSTVVNALGGGLSGASFRFTLYDGDNASGDFDFNQNFLFVNNVDFGNWSNVVTQRTDSAGTAIGATHLGFRDEILDTGWFTTTDSLSLNALYTSLVNTSSLIFQVKDSDVGDNFYDFKRGVNGSLLNVGQPPVIKPPSSVPAPASLLLVLCGLGWLVRRRAA